MLQNETELILLTTWTLKRHTEDVKLFESHLFTRPSWFEAIQKGKNYMQIRSLNLLEGMSIADVSTYANKGYYKETLAEALTEQRNAYMERAKKEDSQIWLDKALHIQSIIDGTESTPHATNLKELFMKEFEAELNEENPHFGFKKLDQYTKGLHAGQLITLAARLGVGKSAFGMQLANNIAMEDYKVIYVPLEMSNYQMIKRLLLTSGTVSKDEMYNANEFIKEQMGKYLDCVELDNNLIFCEDMNKVSAIRQKVREEKPAVVIIDQLSLLQPDEKHSSIREKYIACTRELKRMALEEKVAVVLLAQLNRETTQNSIPTVENIAESDSTAQDSDVVLLMWRGKAESKYEDEMIEKRGLIKTCLRIGKQREGASGINILYWYDGENYQFKED